MILCLLLLQESKPEQCLAGKSHSTGEQPSQLGMATRYSATSPWGVAAPFRVYGQGTDADSVHRIARALDPDGPGLQTWLCPLLNDLEQFTQMVVPKNQMEALAPQIPNFQSKREACMRRCNEHPSYSWRVLALRLQKVGAVVVNNDDEVEQRR